MNSASPAITRGLALIVLLWTTGCASVPRPTPILSTNPARHPTLIVHDEKGIAQVNVMSGAAFVPGIAGAIAQAAVKSNREAEVQALLGTWFAEQISSQVASRLAAGTTGDPAVVSGKPLLVSPRSDSSLSEQLVIFLDDGELDLRTFPPLRDLATHDGADGVLAVSVTYGLFQAGAFKPIYADVEVRAAVLNARDGQACWSWRNSHHRMVEAGQAQPTRGESLDLAYQDYIDGKAQPLKDALLEAGSAVLEAFVRDLSGYLAPTPEVRS